MAARAPWTRTQVAGVVALVVAAVVALVSLRVGQGRRHPVVKVQRVAVPSYFVPGQDWVRLAAGAPTVGLAIVNPSSGSGVAPWPELAASVGTVRAAGVQVLGYVDTAFGARAQADVELDVARYYDWYGVDGVFFDQMSALCLHVDYYRALAGGVAERGGRTVLNPGTNPDGCYADVGDVLVVFEGTPATYAHWNPASWQWKQPADRFWHLVYGVEPSQQADVVDSTKHRNAGWVYVTPDNLPNPWGRLPPESQWSALLSAASGAPPPSSSSG